MLKQKKAQYRRIKNKEDYKNKLIIKEFALFAQREHVNFAIPALIKKVKIEDSITDALTFTKNKSSKK